MNKPSEDPGPGQGPPPDTEEPLITWRTVLKIVAAVFVYVSGSVLLVYLLPPGPIRQMIVGFYKATLALQPMLPALVAVYYVQAMNRRKAEKERGSTRPGSTGQDREP